MKSKQFIKVSFFMALAVLLGRLGGNLLTAPGIESKILGVILILLCGFSAGGALYHCGYYD